MDLPLEKVTPLLLQLNERLQWDPDVEEHIIEDLDKVSTREGGTDIRRWYMYVQTLSLFLRL